MSQARDFYAAQVAKCGAEADATSLANVRDRSLRSQAAWQVLLEREEHAIICRGGRQP